MRGIPAKAAAAAAAMIFLLAGMRSEAAPASGARARFDSLAEQESQLETSYLVIERLYMDTEGKGKASALKRAFSDAELEFLLQNYEKATALLENLLHLDQFHSMPEYGDALYMLAESLYQSKRFHGAKAYFLQYLELDGSSGNAQTDKYQTSLLRFMDLSARFSDFQSIDRFMSRMRKNDGTLPPEVAYAYGKWNFARKDIPEGVRQDTAEKLFELALKARGNFAHQSSYYLGVLAVQRGDLEKAKASFQLVLDLPAKHPSDAMIQEQAHLALGRIFMEEGLFDLAIDRYQYIDYRSDAFVEALYEIAWAYVRRARAGGGDEDYRRALQASERLVATAPDSLSAPDALVLQGHLYLQLGKYEEAAAAYDGVIEKFKPAYDSLAAKLNAQDDPTRFFEDAIDGSGKTFDLERFLPKFAIPWATTEKEIAEAVRITDDIDETGATVTESVELANHLIELLESDRNDLFPLYQRGFSLADELETRLSKLQAELIDLEVAELRASGDADPSVFQKLDYLKSSRQAIEAELNAYPQTKVEHDKWRAELVKKIQNLEQEAHRVSVEAESLSAIQTAIEKFIKDNPQIPNIRRTEFNEQLETERKVAAGLKKAIASKKREIAEEKARLAQLRPNDAPIRARYAAVLTNEQRELEAVRRRVRSNAIPPSEAAALHRKIASLRAKTTKARELLRAEIDRKMEEMHQEIGQEMLRLKDYAAQSRQNASQTRGLIGSIAYQSFKRVLNRFYNVMVKADVGLVDIAWTKKQKQSNSIQTLSIRKSEELQNLRDNFKEAMDDGR